MKRETVAEGASVPEALDVALEELGVQQDAVEYEVIEEGGKKLFGLGSEKPAQVRVWLKDKVVSELDDRDTEAKEESGDEEIEASPQSGPPAPSRPDHIEHVGELSEEQLDQVADEGVSAVQSVLQGFDIAAQIEEYEGDDGEIILDVVGDDLGVLIGRHGRTLDAIQTLVSAITNKRVGFRHPVLVDVEGYRNRRRVKLEEIGRRSADRAVRQGTPVKLRPMSSFERKVVHMYLRDDSRVSTASEGDEPFRQVVITPNQR